jgi:phosphatidylinositol alpha-1,6-mannosyltransferase
VNILLLTSEFAPANGGIGTYAREVASAATDLGARVTVIAPDYGRDNAGVDGSFRFEVQRFPGGLHSMRDLPAKIRLVRRLLGAECYDVVHAADWPFFIPVALSRRQTQARLLMTVHGTEINETQTPLKRLAIRGAGVFGSRTEITANSRYTRELFRGRFAVDEKRIRTVRLGVSDFWFAQRNGRAATRAAFGIAPDRVVIVTVARITRRKGHSVTLAALSTLPKELRERILWLVIGPDGEKDYVRQLKHLVASVDCDIRFLGVLPDKEIRDIYGAADFFCLTGVPDTSGRVEGFGLVYLEAAAGGLPSVATAIGGVADAVLDEETGFLVQPSIEDIARAIARLAEDSDTRSVLAAGASAHARALSWERCAAETYGLPRAGLATSIDIPDRLLTGTSSPPAASTPQVHPA